MKLAELAEPGRPREAAVRAITRELHLGLGICRDRADALARRLLTAAIDAAEGTTA